MNSTALILEDVRKKKSKKFSNNQIKNPIVNEGWLQILTMIGAKEIRLSFIKI